MNRATERGANTMNNIDRAEKHRCSKSFLTRRRPERLYNSFETYAAAREAAVPGAPTLEAALGDDIFAERFRWPLVRPQTL